MAEPDGWGACVLPFHVDESWLPEQAFVFGFEAGRVWGVLQESFEEEHFYPVHAANAEMWLRMGKALDRQVRWDEVDETWVNVTFGAPYG